MDYRIHGSAADGMLRMIGCIIPDSVRTIQKTQDALPVAAAAMGRVTAAAVILSASFKTFAEDFRVSVSVEGGGPLGRILAQCRTGGLVRARVEHPHVDLPLRADGKLPVGQAVGINGLFKVAREGIAGTAYEGQVPLVSGEIAEDLAQYYLLSDQVASAAALGVLVGQDGWVQSAGGLVVQAMPGCSDALIDTVADRYQKLSHISHLLAEG
ncbi:MAG: Hsp33 family molecular chaperone HslO, partial [Firmicutes bacterium]|nr:Hsp33 family molecular chaperone HslO [Bacillota bacterium]